MKAGWETQRLGELCDVVNGGTPKTAVPEYWNGKHLWITPAEMGKRLSPYVDDTERKISDLGLRDSSARLLPPHSVILSSRAPIGHLVINTKPMSTNQGCKGLIPSKKIEHKFLYFYLTSIVELLDSLGTGATFRELSGGKLKEVPVPVPPLPEQERIVAILDEAFTRLATAKANAEKNLQNARALFESHLQSVFTQRGPGWVEKSLEELGTITSSKRIFKSEYVGSGVPFYRTKEIKQLANGRAITTELFISEARYKEIKTSFGVPQKGDILLTAIGTIGEIWVVEGDNDFYFKDGNVLWLKEFTSINPHFLKYVLVSFVESLNKMAHGSAYSALPIQRLNEHRIFLPSPAEQEAIVATLDSLNEETQHLARIYEQKLTALEALKRSLLHHAFTGQLK
jgi:type I restriction enzyme, S subunit